MNQRFRKAIIFYGEIEAGLLEETETGFRFTYSEEFLNSPSPVSITLPVRKEPYEDRELFPFFQGLLPEGWYLDIVLMKMKIDRNDLFGILLATCGETIGMISIKEAE